MKSKVVIVIPTYNEADNVGPVTRALIKVFALCQAYDMHILFVDDLSPDGTAKIITSLAKQNPRVHLLSNKRKGGLGHAYKKGFAVALDKYRADIIFEFDADLQHDPAIIPAMLQCLANGSNLVLGSRYIKGGGIPTSWPFFRRFLSVMGNIFIRLVMNNWRLRDWTTGYRAISSLTVKDILPSMHEAAFHGYTWQIGFLVKTIQKGYKVAEVPFVFRDRKQGHSKLGPEYIINTMSYILQSRISELLLKYNRIIKFVMVGGFGSLIQLIALHFYRLLFQFNLGPLTPYQIALILAIETAIISNFTWSNLWTFKDRKLKVTRIPLKFIQFNLASGGSLLIQFIIASVGERLIGLFTILTFAWPFTVSIDTGLIFAVIGILVGMFWNFFAYSHFVWKKK